MRNNSLKAIVFTLLCLLLTCSTHERDSPFDPLGVAWHPPLVAMMSDTTVAINDSFYVHANGISANGEIARFVWGLHDSALMEDNTFDRYFRDTTTERKIKVAFSSPGFHMVAVKALREDGLSSWQIPVNSSSSNPRIIDPYGMLYEANKTGLPQSIADMVTFVRVEAYPPNVNAMSDTTVAIYDSIWMHATGSDVNGSVQKYVWALGGSKFLDTTVVNQIRVAFDTTGIMRILVQGIDDDRQVSAVDTVNVSVQLYAPVVVGMNDTSVATNDSFTVHAVGSDTNGRVTNYLWAIDGKIFQDTTATGEIRVSFDAAGIGAVLVIGVDNSGVRSTSDTMKVFIKNRYPTSVSPLPGSSTRTNPPVLRWSAGTYCDRFKIALDTIFDNPTVVSTVVRDTVFTPLDSMIYDKTYYWYILGINDIGDEAASPIGSFTILPPPPAAPNLTLPADAAKSISLSPILTWDTIPMTATYRVQLSSTNAFIAGNDWDVVSAYKSVGGLVRGTTYYWRVSARNTGGTSNWSTVWSFTTIPNVPVAPTLVSPGNGGTLRLTPGSGYLVLWNSTTAATSFHIQVATDATFNAIVCDYSEESNGTTSHSTTVGIGQAGTYYWRVSAENTGGTSPWSAVWRFVY